MDGTPEKIHLNVTDGAIAVPREQDTPGFRRAVEGIRSGCIELVGPEILELQYAVLNPNLEMKVLVDVIQSLVFVKVRSTDLYRVRAFEEVVCRHQTVSIGSVRVGSSSE